ncbi:MAG TPA: hypothetical protein VM715_05910 [Candidatus Acidoferrum sp.]|nr:hypothetical protein [Candidatus Acidoferrum sp.]
MSISFHGPTAVNGSYNLIGIEDGAFFLQGNLTKAQIKELDKEIKKLVKTWS